MDNEHERPENAASLSDPQIANNALMIGFSFTLRSDGSPGVCNVEIARAMKKDMLRAPKGARPMIGMQWEIFDALSAMADFDVQKCVKLSHVAPPPPIVADDILNPEELARLLTNPTAPAERNLAKKIVEKADSPLAPVHDPGRLASLLTVLLDDRHLYETFENVLDLYDLLRPEKRPVGVEKREMPRKSHYGNSGLGTFQARRVNRLIIEAVVSNKVLKEGKYLNTEGVARHVVEQISREEQEVKHVFIYAHPEHRGWCKKNVVRVVKEAGLDLSDDCVYFGDNTLWDCSLQWDPKSAQVWCRSAENFEYYTKI